LAVVRSSRGSGWLSLPAATLVLTAVYVAGAAVALLVGGPAQRLVGVAVLAVTAARLAALWATTGRRGAAPWS
jgi:hypothetical protein